MHFDAKQKKQKFWLTLPRIFSKDSNKKRESLSFQKTIIKDICVPKSKNNKDLFSSIRLI